MAFEAPLNGRLADANRMVEECYSRGVSLAVELVIPSHSDYRKAHEMVADYEIDEVYG